MASGSSKSLNSGELREIARPSRATLVVDVPFSRIKDKVDLSGYDIIETILAIIKHVYTGDETVQIVRYARDPGGHRKSQRINEYHVEPTMSAQDVLSTVCGTDVLEQEFDDQEATSLVPSIASIVKHTALLTQDQDDDASVANDFFVNNSEASSQSRVFCCFSAHLDPTRVTFSYPEGQQYHQAVTHVADTLEKISFSMIHGWDLAINTANILGPLNYTTIASSLQASARTSEHCLHDIIVEQAERRPLSMAVDAWDGGLTYAELYRYSVRLAGRLMCAGVKPQDRIPFCMNKSKWGPVVIFGILFAGATCVPFDVRAPQQRIEMLVEKLGAHLVVTDGVNAQKFDEVKVETLICSDQEGQVNVDSVLPNLPPASPSSVAFIYFTSGSTGVPKGVVDVHKDLYINLEALAKAYSLDESSRMLQYASYIFDVSVGDILGVMVAGGCVCIPSEEQRLNNPSETIQGLRATHACLTNTVISQLFPEQVPTLQHLFVAGEALDKAQFLRWKDFVSFNNVYGTTESIIVDTLATSSELAADTKNLGRTTIGTCLWIVDSEDPERLQPVGAIGEILIEGPALGREYMDDPITTAAKFIEAPGWLRRLRPSESIRAYRTGDMGFSNLNGSITFAGRADTQVKLRGQRIELLEIENVIRRLDGFAGHVVIEAVVLPSRGNMKTIAAFFTDSEFHGDGPLLPMTSDRRTRFLQIRHDLLLSLPQYMIPSLFIPLSDLPRTVTGKLDRKGLKQLITAVSEELISPYYLTVTAAKQPNTDAERMLQQAWATVLHIPEKSINIDDNFFQIGGDSVKAMQLAATLRESGSDFMTSTVFRHPKLCDMAAESKFLHSVCDDNKIEPFALLRTSEKGLESNLQALATACGVSVNSVVDAYPASPMQEALMAISVRRPAIYRQQAVMTLPKHMDVSRFKSAVEALISAQGVLRTRIVVIQEFGTLQVILRPEQLAWRTHSSLQQYLAHDRDLPFNYGNPLCRFGIVEEQGRSHFIWTAHHSIYDGWSRALMYEELYQTYEHDSVTPEVPYSRFIQHVTAWEDANEADDFWRDQFPDKTEKYPPIPHGYIPEPTQTQSLEFRVIRHSESNITLATLIQAAWALVAAKQTGTNDAVFGAPLSGRDAPVLGITKMMGPTITTVPLRVVIDNTLSIAEYLHQVQEQISQLRSYQHVGLQQIRRLSEEASAAVGFATILVVHPDEYDQLGSLSKLGLRLLSLEETDSMDMPLTIQCTINSAGKVTVKAQYDAKVTPDRLLRCLLHQLEHVTIQLATESTQTSIYSLDMISAYDLRQYEQWYSIQPIAVEATLHGLFRDQVLRSPEALAINGFDGNYSYRELDIISDRLAQYLLRLGVGAEQNVVLAFAKSSRPIISMLAVLKCGGVCCSVNPEHPDTRILEICDEVEAKVLLCDTASVHRFSDHVGNAIAIDSPLIERLDLSVDQNFPEVSSNNASFIVYTSGSTGKPKGSILEHRNLCTSLTAIGKNSNMSAEVRTLQFSAYTFDAHILEIFGTFLHGGCVCVISDSERMDNLEDVMNQREMNWSLLTPTVARLLSPEKVPTLSTLILSGEPLAQRDLHQWAGKTRLLNGLGPSECSILACITDTMTTSSLPSNIGFPIGCHVWITEQRRPDRLAPLGSVGELLLEGPIIGRGYIKRPKATAVAFIKDPAWSKNLSEGSRRFYRTGDLARLCDDGSIIFVGRADTQVKIRGQRVELEEIEHQVKASGHFVKQVAVEAIKLANRGDAQVLAAFISCEGTTRADDRKFLEMVPQLRARVINLQASLRTVLPRYMIPVLFFPIQRMPISPSGKLERKSLRQWVTALNAGELEHYFLREEATTQAPSSESEQLLCKTWAEVLQIPENSIGVDDNFFTLGGDSVTAMKLIAIAKASGISLTVAKVFQFPCLNDMANTMEVSIPSKQMSTVSPFSLLPSSNGMPELVDEISRSCHIMPESIEDAYPATPIQEALLAVSSYRPWAYTHQAIFQLSPSLDVGRFKDAWDCVIRAQSILRTRVVVTQDIGTIQVVLNTNGQWHTSSSLEQYLPRDQRIPMTYGTELSRWAITSEEVPHFIWTCHHSIYDGWSLNRIFDEVKQIYHSRSVGKVVPYTNFVQYLMKQDKLASDEFWRQQFPGYTQNYPSLVRLDYKPVARNLKSYRMFLPPRRVQGLTMASVVKAAWALLLTKYTGDNKALFGLTLSGRDIAVDDVTEIMGPTLTTVPMRVPVDQALSVAEFLKRVQHQVTRIRQHQHTGLQHIRRLSPEAAQAVTFQNLLVIQNVGDEELRSSLDDFGLKMVDHEEKDFFNLALSLECIVRQDSIAMNLRYDEQMTSHLQSERLLLQLQHTISTLLNEENQEIHLADLNLVSQEELKLLLSWYDDSRSGTPDTSASTSHSSQDSLASESTKVSGSMGNGLWVVERGRPDRLAPIGCIGELFTEQPQFLAELKEFAEYSAFDIAWSEATSHASTQMYRTGDLAKVNADGSLSVLGPADSQLKIRGQSVELSGIEELICQIFPVGSRIVVDVVLQEFKTTEPELMAFVRLPCFADADEAIDQDIRATHQTLLRTTLRDLEQSLGDMIPEYLTPSIYIPVVNVPTMKTGKIDRQKLNEYAKALPLDAKCVLRAHREQDRPRTEIERLLYSIWCRILDCSEIGIHDTFTSLGGDSINAMQVVTACRKANIDISVSSILSKKTISAISPLCTKFEIALAEAKIVPSPDDVNLRDLIAKVLPLIGINIDDVEKVFACTAMQEGILLSQQKDEGSYRTTWVWEIHDSHVTENISFSNVESAWQSLVSRHSTMRTGILEDGTDQGIFLQAVLKRAPARIRKSQKSYKEATEVANVELRVEDGFWSHLPYLTVFELQNGNMACRMDACHTMLDGPSVDILIDEFAELLMKKSLHNSGTDYAKFVSYEQSLSKADALSYWSRYLSDTRPCHLPLRNQTASSRIEYGVCELSKNSTDEITSFCKTNGITPATFIQTAWSILLGTFTGTNDICFGYLASDRDAPVDEIENAIGLYISMQICRVRLQGLVEDVIHRIQGDIAESFSHRHCSLASIHNALGLNETSLFNTCLTLTHGTPAKAKPLTSQVIKMHYLPQRTEYAIALNACVYASGVDMVFFYRRNEIPDHYAETIGRSLESILQSIMIDFRQPVKDVNLISPRDHSLMEKWSTQLPIIDKTTLELVEEQAVATPDAVAISSFEGNWTYAEFNHLAGQIASYLVDNSARVGPEIPIMVCFNKSVWNIVSMLAAWKCESFFVFLNPDHPTERLLSICEDAGTSVVLCDQENYARFHDPLTVVKIDSAFFDNLKLQSNHEKAILLSDIPHLQNVVKRKSGPENIAAVVYTSGSTGKPKGSIWEHRGLSTALISHSKRMVFDATSRVLQYAPCTFDMSYFEIFGPLVRGGCVCVISEEQRLNHLSQVCKDQSVNWTFMTPSVLKLLSPKDIPSLKTIAVGGESASKQVVQDWCEHVLLVNIWGPAEAIMFSSYGIMTAEGNPDNIGRSANCNLWITEQGNPDKLVPIGCIGEILIEGPSLSRGYLNNAEADRAFITDPMWARNGQTRRFYRSGDLGYFNSDGSVIFLGRADTQIKINGQRIEVGEIEHQIQRVLPEKSQVVVDVVDLPKLSGSTLVAFIKSGRTDNKANTSTSDSSLDLQEDLQPMIADIDRRLDEVLPRYMIPTVYIPVRSMPSNISRKTDRRALKSHAQNLPLEAMCIQGLNVKKRQPSNEIEAALQNIWASLLRTPIEKIGTDDAFTSLGGDSITAIRVVSECHKANIRISVASIFKKKTIRNIAQTVLSGADHPKVLAMTDGGVSMSSDVQTVSYADLKRSVDGALSQLMSESGNVADILPLAPYQTVSVRGNMANPPRNWSFLFIDLPDDIETGRLKVSCQALVDHFDILRTIFVKTKNDQLLQVVLKKLQPLFNVHNTQEDIQPATESVCYDDLMGTRSLGESFLRFIFVSTPSAKRLILRISHAQFDGYSCDALINTFSALYENRPVTRSSSFAKFVRFTSSRDRQSYDHWRHVLNHSQPTMSPLIMRKRVESNDPSGIHFEKETSPILPHAGATAATVFTTACALLLSRLTGLEDVLFGRIVSGRSSLPQELTNAVGPCLNIIPVRAQLKPDESLSSLLSTTQTQTVNSSAYESTALDDIISHCLPNEAAWPVNSMGHSYFPVITQYQNVSSTPSVASSDSSTSFKLSVYDCGKVVHSFPESLCITGIPKEDGKGLTVSLGCGADWCDVETLRGVCEQLCEILEGLEKRSESTRDMSRGGDCSRMMVS